MTEPYSPQPNQPNQPGQPMPYGQSYPPVQQEHPQGTTVLVLGIVGIFFGIAAPFAWYLGNKAMKEIRASGQTYSNEQTINIGRILGIVFTIIYLVSIVFTIIFVIIVAVAAMNTN
jgi:hypothetical protein